MFKQYLFYLIALLVEVYTLYTNVGLIGTEKSQEVTILKKTELVYPITGGELYKLIPLHFFTFFNRNEMILRMECFINGRTDACNEYEERKCQIHGLKEPAYDNCMLT